MIDKYIPQTILQMKVLKTILPLTPFSHVQTCLHLLDSSMNRISELFIIPIETNSKLEQKQLLLLEMYFIFSIIWSFGGSLSPDDEDGDYQLEFSQWWEITFPTIKFPERGLVFDYFIDDINCIFVPWSSLINNVIQTSVVPQPPTNKNNTYKRKTQILIKEEKKDKLMNDDHEENNNINLIYVPTTYSIRICSIMKLLIDNEHPLMCVGNSGVGKTMYLNSIINEKNAHTIYCHYYMNVNRMQMLLELPLERKAGRVFAPMASEKCIYFIEDINMPQVDK
jgi:dynein heavy chain